MLLRDGAAGTAGADGVAQLAVLLDDAFLAHHQRFRRGDQIDVMAEVRLGGGERHEAAAQGRGDAVAEQDFSAFRRGPGDVAVGRFAGAETHAHVAAVVDQQLAVPLRLGRQGGPVPVGLEQGHDLVAVAVLDAGFNAHDKRHLHALIGGHPGDVLVRRRVVRLIVEEGAGQARVHRIEPGDERLQLAGGHVLETVFGGLVALRVGGGVVAAGPGPDLGAGKHRAAVGMVDQRLLQYRAVGQGHPQGVGAGGHAVDQAFEGLSGAPKPVADVGVAEADTGVIEQRGVVGGDRDQGVAAADQVGAAGQHPDAAFAGHRRRRFSLRLGGRRRRAARRGRRGARAAAAGGGQ